MTLVEVVAAVALLSGVLVSVLLARGRLATQSVYLARKAEAIEALDHWLDTHAFDNSLSEESSLGELSEDLRWRSKEISVNWPEPLEAKLLRIEVIGEVDGREMVLASVDLVTPIEPPTPNDSREELSDATD